MSPSRAAPFYQHNKNATLEKAILPHICLLEDPIEMDDEDDEFGDLYTDMFRPLDAAPPSQTLASSDPIDDDDDELEILYGSHSSAPTSSPSSRHYKTLPPLVHDEDRESDWLTGGTPTALVTAENWDEEEEKYVTDRPSIASMVLETTAEARVSDWVADDAEVGGFRIQEEDRGAVPGLSPSPQASLHPPAAINMKDMKTSASEDWDSDSEDDLQIVLNGINPLLPAGGQNDGDDEDGEEDLVIVTDVDQPHHHQLLEEQDWGEEAMQPMVDGEMKETTDAVKPYAAVGGAPPARTGYNNRGLHPQHHSVYKYIRPGAGPVLGGPMVGTTGGPGQIHPHTLGPIFGRGRGDCRPMGIRGPLNTQKTFDSGYGLSSWANNSSVRAFGNGCDFTLPLHKTIFEVSIEGFEEKPWRYPGVDSSDFFNFGLDEDKWKDYCKQLEQLRLEGTMQSKICVYESGRSEQGYDPDLPHELALAAGHRDKSIGNAHNYRMENGRAELKNDPGKEVTCIPTQLPIGRAIQVGYGYSDRLPSMDTRAPRNRYSEAIIEIVLQDTLDSPKTDGELKKAMVTRKAPFAPKGDGILPCPSESPLRCHPLQSLVDFSGTFDAHLGGRFPQETSVGRHSTISGYHSSDAITVNRYDRRQIERPRDITERKRTTEKDPSMEKRGAEVGDRLAICDDIDIEEDDMALDFQESTGDDGFTRPTKKQNLRSRVEQPLLKENSGDDLRTTNSGNDIAKSGNSRDHQRSKIDRNRVPPRGLEPLHHLHRNRDRDSVSAQTVRGRNGSFERPKEMDGTNNGRQRREDDIQNRRVKDENTRQDRHEESSRNTNKVKAGDRTNKGDGLHSKKQGDVGDPRNHQREGDTRQKDMKDNLVRRREADGPSSKREKDEERSRRERIKKEHISHNYRAREESGRRKREGNDGADHRRGDDSRTRTKVEECHSVKHKDEKAERLRLKSQIELPRLSERECHGGAKNSRATRDKPLNRNGKSEDSTRDLVSDKDNPHKDRRRPNEQSKRLDMASEGNYSKKKGQEDGHAHDKQIDSERSTRHEKFISHSGRPSNGWDRDNKHRENTRKGRDIKVNVETHGSMRIKQEDHSNTWNDKIDEDTSGQENNFASPTKNVHHQNIKLEAPQLHHSSGELGDEEYPSSEDENQKGRSKLERWTRHRERDFTGTEIIQTIAPISGISESEDLNAEMFNTDKLLKADVGNPNDSNPSGVDAGQTRDHMVEDRDRHLDTVEKLKRRSERFKLPMPGEKAASTNKEETEVFSPSLNEAVMVDAEVIQERPSRKRRWTGS